MGPKQFPVVLFAKAANYCKLTKFRCFKNRTAAHGCEFLFAMLWSLLHLIFEGKMQNHLEAARSIWTLKLPLCSEPVCHSHQFSRPGLTSPILDSRSSILDPRFSIPDSRFSILHSRFSILDPRSRILDPRFPLLDSRSSIFEPRFTVLDRHGGPSGSYTCKISWDFVRILENTALLPVMYGCTDVQVPPPFIHFIPMLWGLLACVALLHTGGYYWNHLELLGFSWMCPTPSTWNVWLHWCAGPPPLSYILFPCSGLCWHALPFSLLLETIGTTWNS